MNEELAEYVATSAFKSLSDLGRLLAILKESLSDDEYEPYKKTLAYVCALIAEEILLEVFSSHPNIEQKINSIIDKYGKLP